MAEAKESVRTALVSSQTAVAGLARRVVLTAKDAALPAVSPGQMDAAADSKDAVFAMPPADLSRVLPNQTLPTPTVPAANVAPAGSPKDQAAVPNEPATSPMLANASSNGPATISDCHYRHVWGRVISAQAIAMTGFGCDGVEYGYVAGYGPCPNFETNPDADVGSLSRREPQSYLRACKLDVTMSVDLADPADVSKMQSGKLVNLAGNVHVRKEKNRPDYLYMTNAKVVWTDPFERQAVNASPAVALHDQPAGLSITPKPSAGPAQAALSTPPATPPKLDANAPYKKMECGFIASGVGSGFVEGRVISSTTIQMPKLSCGGPGGVSFSAAGGGVDGVGGGADVSFPMGPPCDRAHSIRSSIWGRYCPNVPWAVMNVQLANPADASKMPLGKVVALRGDFFVITQNNVQYWGVQNARVLYVDPFDRQAADATPAKTPSDRSVKFVSSVAPGPGNDLHTRTEQAMKCWLGLVENKGCGQSDVCNAGPVERVEYLGSTATGGEVYQVRYQFETDAYVIVPDLKRNAGQYLVKPSDKYWIKRQISRPAAPILIYTRPENASHGACPRDYDSLFGPPGPISAERDGIGAPP